MDAIWKAKKRDVKRTFPNLTKKERSRIEKVVIDSQYGTVGHVNKFECVLPNGDRIIEWP